MSKMKKDELPIKGLLTEAIQVLCKASLSYRSFLTIEGLIAVTLDDEKIILVNLNEKVQKEPQIEIPEVEDHSKTNKSIVNEKPVCPNNNKRKLQEHSEPSDFIAKQIKVEPVEPIDPIIIKEEKLDDSDYSKCRLSDKKTHQSYDTYSSSMKNNFSNQNFSCTASSSNLQMSSQHNSNFHSNDNSNNFFVNSNNIAKISQVDEKFSKNSQSSWSSNSSSILSPNSNISDIIPIEPLERLKDSQNGDLSWWISNENKSSVDSENNHAFENETERIAFLSAISNNSYVCQTGKTLCHSRTALLAHIHPHTGEKLFQCNICQKEFNLKGNLKKHLFIHQSEKPFQCSICQKEFTAKGNLKKHLATHQSQRPFCCPICRKTFNQLQSSKIHMIKKHEISSDIFEPSDFVCAVKKTE